MFVGFEGSLWLVGRDAQGQTLFTLSVPGVARWFEPTLGLGLRFGHGLGPAGSAALRFRVPPTGRAALLLRYDAALLQLDPGLRAPQHSLTVGAEWAF